MTFTPSVGRVTGKVFNALLNKYETVSYSVGVMTSTRRDNQHKRNASIISAPPKPELLLRKYDPQTDSYSDYLEHNGSYPKHFEVEK